MLAANEKGLAFVGELEFRQPINEVDNCNIADIFFIFRFFLMSVFSFRMTQNSIQLGVVADF